MKIRFEIDLPELVLDEEPKDNWSGLQDKTIEYYLLSYAETVVEEGYGIKINQDDLKEFIKQVREHGKS